MGTGLIGGSLALDLKERGLAGRVTGTDTDPSCLGEALERGILDEAAPLDRDVIRGCDIVILAVPVIALESVLRAGFDEGTLVTDVGSVKGNTVAAYRDFLSGGGRYRYVPGHPIAGDERSGPAAARTGLFKGANVILTPVEDPGPDVETVRTMWEGVGATVQIMDPAQHDAVFAWVSHMPHMAAYAIVDSILARDPEMVRLSGGGLKDYTRIAASSPRMWAEIAVANREKLLSATEGLRSSVDRIMDALKRGDRAELERIFEVIATARRRVP